MEWCSRRLAILQRAGSIDVETVSLSNLLLWLWVKHFVVFQGANHKTLHRLSQATVAPHPHLVRVQIVSTTVHRHQLLNGHHLKRHRVWTITSTAAIRSTTNISSRRQRSNESVTTRSPTQWTAWDRRTFTRVAMETSERATMTIIMGELFSSMISNGDSWLIKQCFFKKSSNTTPNSLEDSGLGINYSVIGPDAINKRIASPINGGQSKSSNGSNGSSTEKRSQRNGNRANGMTQSNNTSSSSYDTTGNSDDCFRESLSKNGSSKSSFR